MPWGMVVVGTTATALELERRASSAVIPAHARLDTAAQAEATRATEALNALQRSTAQTVNDLAASCSDRGKVLMTSYKINV